MSIYANIDTRDGIKNSAIYASRATILMHENKIQNGIPNVTCSKRGDLSFLACELIRNAV